MFEYLKDFDHKIYYAYLRVEYDIRYNNYNFAKDYNRLINISIKKIKNLLSINTDEEFKNYFIDKLYLDARFYEMIMHKINKQEYNSESKIEYISYFYQFIKAVLNERGINVEEEFSVSYYRDIIFIQNNHVPLYQTTTVLQDLTDKKEDFIKRENATILSNDDKKFRFRKRFGIIWLLILLIANGTAYAFGYVKYLDKYNNNDSLMNLISYCVILFLLLFSTVYFFILLIYKIVSSSKMKNYSTRLLKYKKLKFDRNGTLVAKNKKTFAAIVLVIINFLLFAGNCFLVGMTIYHFIDNVFIAKTEVFNMKLLYKFILDLIYCGAALLIYQMITVRHQLYTYKYRFLLFETKEHKILYSTTKKKYYRFKKDIDLNKVNFNEL